MSKQISCLTGNPSRTLNGRHAGRLVCLVRVARREDITMHHHVRLLGLSLTALALCGCGADSNPTTGPTAIGSTSANRVALEAMVSNRSGSCPNLTFRLGGITVQTVAITQFDLSCDRIVNGAAVNADGPSLAGNLLARRIGPEADALVDPQFQAEGPLESASSPGDCRTTGGRDLAVAGLRFIADNSTRFQEIAGCESLALGTRIRAKGPLINPPLSPVLPLRATEVERR
jgi:hypothetical protein